jgi:hypothetical protein
MSDHPTGRGAAQFPLRLPEGMRDRIKAAAQANGRSMNAEIVSALTEKYSETESLETSLAMIERLHNLRAQAISPDTHDHYDKALKRAYRQLQGWVGSD